MMQRLRLCDCNIFDFPPVSSNCLKRLDEFRASAANPLRRKGHRSCCRGWGGPGLWCRLDFDLDPDFDPDLDTDFDTDTDTDTDRTADNSFHHEAITRP